MSKDDSSSDIEFMSDAESTHTEPNLERTREEKLKSLAQRESVSEETRELAKRALARRQEGSS